MKPPLQRLLEHLEEEIKKTSDMAKASAAANDIGRWSMAMELKAWITANLPESTGDGWMPIETAPKDGRIILCCWDYDYTCYPHIEAMSYNGVWTYSYDGDSPPRGDDPTHWRPLPEPPAGKEEA